MHILSTIKSYYETLHTTKYPDENLTSNYNFDAKIGNRLQDQDQSIAFQHSFYLEHQLKKN
jgi:hypothetical protein